MHLNFVAQLLELGVDIFLLWFRFLTRSLELNQQWATARYPEDSIWVPGVARCHKL